MAERITQLDAIRGLAALSVVAHHCLLVFPEIADSPVSAKAALVLNTPLHLFFAGGPAVLLFFVLSGFVLALPYFDGETVRYSDYLIRRVCRIYLPYVAAVLIGAICMTCFYSGTIPQASGWFKWVWGLPASSGLILDHLLLLKSFDNARIDPVIWSLVVEMRMSLIFPILVLAVRKFGWPVCLLSAVFFNLDPLKWEEHFFPSLVGTDYVSSLKYAFYFFLGISLAKYRKTAVDIIASKTGKRLRMSLLGIFVLLYTLKYWEFMQTPGRQDLSDILAGVASCIIICLALGWRSFTDILNRPPFQFLGRISYSLYLVHSIVLMSVIHLLHSSAPLYALVALSFFLSLPFGWIAYSLFEKPSMALGRALSRSKRQVTHDDRPLNLAVGVNLDSES